MKRKINKLVIFTTRESVFKNDLKVKENNAFAGY